MQRITALHHSVVVPSGARIAIHDDGTVVVTGASGCEVEFGDLEDLAIALVTVRARIDYAVERELPELVDVGGEA